MTTYKIISRPFAALSAILTLATAVAVIAAPAPARADSAIFSVFVDDSDDAGFMDYTDDDGVSSLTSAQAGAVAPAASSGAGAAAKVPAAGVLVPPKPAVNIIMRDGGICDPIRHMGC
jgi:hypothetical protein